MFEIWIAYGVFLLTGMTISSVTECELAWYLFQEKLQIDEKYQCIRDVKLGYNLYLIMFLWLVVSFTGKMTFPL